MTAVYLMNSPTVLGGKVRNHIEMHNLSETQRKGERIKGWFNEMNALANYIFSAANRTKQGQSDFNKVGEYYANMAAVDTAVNLCPPLEAQGVGLVSPMSKILRVMAHKASEAERLKAILAVMRELADIHFAEIFSLGDKPLTMDDLKGLADEDQNGLLLGYFFEFGYQA